MSGQIEDYENPRTGEIQRIDWDIWSIDPETRPVTILAGQVAIKLVDRSGNHWIIEVTSSDAEFIRLSDV